MPPAPARLLLQGLRAPNGTSRLPCGRRQAWGRVSLVTSVPWDSGVPVGDEEGAGEGVSVPWSFWEALVALSGSQPLVLRPAPSDGASAAAAPADLAEAVACGSPRRRAPGWAVSALGPLAPLQNCLVALMKPLLFQGDRPPRGLCCLPLRIPTNTPGLRWVQQTGLRQASPSNPATSGSAHSPNLSFF